MKEIIAITWHLTVDCKLQRLTVDLEDCSGVRSGVILLHFRVRSGVILLLVFVLFLLIIIVIMKTVITTIIIIFNMSAEMHVHRGL